MWMYDLAREQSPTLDHLRTFCELSRDAGYNALGLYLEHRFAYASTPWAHGRGSVTAEMVAVIQDEFPDLQIIPFVNLLGHFEGLLYTENGRKYAEENFKGMQACPSKPALLELVNALIDDVVAVFKSDIIHIGGDETTQLGKCPVCAERVRKFEETPGVDGKAKLYGEHFGVLSERVRAAGRRPAVWGDMFFDHPTALENIHKDTVIFDWQYFKGPSESSRVFREAGYDVVYCPTLQTYNASWLHLPQSEANTVAHIRAAAVDNVLGMCLTTWECGLFGNYETLLPAIRTAGNWMVSPATMPTDEPTSDDRTTYRDATGFQRGYLAASERHEEWARLMGSELQNAGGIFTYTGIRSSLKCRLLLYSNPFLFWRHHGEALSSEVGARALEILDHAISVAPDVAYRGVSEFVRSAIEFARYAESAHLLYAAGIPGQAAAALMPCRQVFENLAKIAKSNHLRIGGSLADIERCVIAQRHVEVVIRRIKDYGDGALGYLPSFETITHPKFVPHDQANWWLINDWANE